MLAIKAIFRPRDFVIEKKNFEAETEPVKCLIVNIRFRNQRKKIVYATYLRNQTQSPPARRLNSLFRGDVGK